MNTLTVLLVISVCCTVGYCRSLRTRRFVPYFGPGYDIPDAVQDYIYNHYFMTGTFPSWAMPQMSPYNSYYSPYRNLNQVQGQFQGQVQGQRQPAPGTTYQPTQTTQQQQPLTTAQRSRLGLVPGQTVFDPRFGSGTVSRADGTDGKIIARDGSIVSVDGSDISRDGW